MHIILCLPPLKIIYLTTFVLYYPQSSPHHCASEATGLGFLCFVIYPRVLSANRVVFFLFHKLPILPPPPPQTVVPYSLESATSDTNYLFNVSFAPGTAGVFRLDFFHSVTWGGLVMGAFIAQQSWFWTFYSINFPNLLFPPPSPRRPTLFHSVIRPIAPDCTYGGAYLSSTSGPCLPCASGHYNPVRFIVVYLIFSTTTTGVTCSNQNILFCKNNIFSYISYILQFNKSRQINKCIWLP